MPFAQDQQSTAQTDTSLVGAPGANRQIVVKHVFVSADTAMTVTLESGNSSRKWEQYVSANGGHIAVDETGVFSCDANEALTYTTDVAGEVFVQVRYEIERFTG